MLMLRLGLRVNRTDAGAVGADTSGGAGPITRGVDGTASTAQTAQ